MSEQDESLLQKLLPRPLREFAAAAPRWFIVIIISCVSVITIFFIVRIVHDARRMGHEVLIDNIVVPKEFEDRGYTSPVILDLVRDNIELIQGQAQTHDAAKVELAAASEAELPDIVFPKTSLSYRLLAFFRRPSVGDRSA